MDALSVTNSVPTIIGKNSDCSFTLTTSNGSSAATTFNNCLIPSSITGINPIKYLNCDNEYNIVTTAISYTVLAQDRIISCTAGSITITLIANPPTSAMKIIVKDLNGNAAASNITVSGNGHNIDGAATYVMNVNFASATFVWNLTSTTWMVV